jgi:hypothetical protein
MYHFNNNGFYSKKDLHEEGFREALSAFTEAFTDKTEQKVTNNFVAKFATLKNLLEEASDSSIKTMVEKELANNITEAQYKAFVTVLLGTKGTALVKNKIFSMYARVYLSDLLPKESKVLAPYILLKYLLLEGFMGERAMNIGYKKLLKSIKSGNMKDRVKTASQAIAKQQKKAEAGSAADEAAAEEFEGGNNDDNDEV